jgi:serine/threonine protein kinase
MSMSRVPPQSTRPQVRATPAVKLTLACGESGTFGCIVKFDSEDVKTAIEQMANSDNVIVQSMDGAEPEPHKVVNKNDFFAHLRSVAKLGGGAKLMFAGARQGRGSASVPLFDPATCKKAEADEIEGARLVRKALLPQEVEYYTGYAHGHKGHYVFKISGIHLTLTLPRGPVHMDYVLVVMQEVCETDLFTYVNTLNSKMIDEQADKVYESMRDELTALAWQMYQKGVELLMRLHSTMVYGDIKLENVILCDGQLRFIDFGHARALNTELKSDDSPGTDDCLSPYLLQKRMPNARPREYLKAHPISESCQCHIHAHGGGAED